MCAGRAVARVYLVLTRVSVEAARAQTRVAAARRSGTHAAVEARVAVAAVALRHHVCWGVAWDG